jgi:lambda family phage portal protein
MKMTNRYQDVVLQNAVMNATFAATIESELPPEATYQQLGTGGGDDYATKYMSQVANYVGSSNNLKIDNARIPHLWPGQKLKLQNPVAPAGIDNFEQSLLRHVAASLGLSYEQFSRDYTNTSYASARASMAETHKHMMARKKIFADRFANVIYQLWFEEAVNAGLIPMPNGIGASFFYEGMNKDALTNCSWIGASRGQIDPMKETQAAILRIEKGLSTYEIETAALGYDFRDIFNQRQRENTLMQERGLDFTDKQQQPEKENENDANTQD